MSPPNWLDAPLEPSLWLPPDRSPATSTECSEGDSLHDACIEIDDDRIFVTPRRHDQLWFLREPEPRWVVAEPAARRLLIGHLDPGSALVLQGARLDADGQQDDFELQVSLRKPRRHVIINEVLANPLGAEASGEWMEILNDSAGGVSLAGLWLEDTRGRVPLPAAELAPGELALLVAPGFRAVPPDVPVLANVRVLELSSLGERGLANSGEMVLLVGPEGIVSRFPALSAAHAGRSWARVRLDAADDDPRAFAEHGSPGASPGAENSFDPPASSRR